MTDLISEITDSWFLTEPLLFNAFCTHKLVENPELQVLFRAGKLRLEYNPRLLSALAEEGLHGKKLIEDYLKFEVIRIILKHPYQRQPANAEKDILKFASDVTINDTKLFDYSNITTKTAANYRLPQNLCFEEYYSRISRIARNSDDSENAAQIAELWEEDEEAAETVNFQIEMAIQNQQRGTLNERLQKQISTSLQVKMDYRKMLSHFRMTILTANRHLTRMKPNRRYGFSYMGSRYNFVTRLLVAIDVSGSITDEDLQKFLSITNRFFKYGIQTLDVIQFDDKVIEKPVSLKKARQTMEVKGGGGTEFQPPVDFYCKSDYDGMIVFTDGMGTPPEIKRRTPILWVFTSSMDYENSLEWVSALPGSKATYIPL